MTLRCDMTTTCEQPVTHVDAKGYVYCTCHGEQRRAAQPCRKLRPHEIQKLINNQPIKY